MSHDQTHKNRTLWLVGTLHAFTHLYQVALLPLYFRIQQDLKLNSVEKARCSSPCWVLPIFSQLPPRSTGGSIKPQETSYLRIGHQRTGIHRIVSCAKLWLALVGAALAGFGGSFYHPSATALIARLFPDSKGARLGWSASAPASVFSPGQCMPGGGWSQHQAGARRFLSSVHWAS